MDVVQLATCCVPGSSGWQEHSVATYLLVLSQNTQGFTLPLGQFVQLLRPKSSTVIILSKYISTYIAHDHLCKQHSEHIATIILRMIP